MNVHLFYIFQLHLYFMWAGIEVGAAILMFVITQKVKGPLEKFKVENSKDGPANTKDVQLETVDKK